MFKSIKSKVLAFGVALVAGSSFANAGLTAPTVDTADLYTIAGVVVGLVAVVFLIRKAVSLFGR